jgi:hypothetical protein
MYTYNGYTLLWKKNGPPGPASATEEAEALCQADTHGIPNEEWWSVHQINVGFDIEKSLFNMEKKGVLTIKTRI